MSYTPNVDEQFEQSIRGNKIQGNQQPQPRVSAQDIEDIDIPLMFFNAPRKQGRDASQQPNSTIKNAYGTISHINADVLGQKKKRKLSIFEQGVIFISLLGILAILFSSKFNKAEQQTIVTPDGFVQILAMEEVNYGESIYSIASEYYDQHIYSAMYESINDYIDTIIEANDLSYGDHITPNDALYIPILVNVNNTYYQELKKLESQIKKIKEDAYWIDYTVQYGDNLSSIAAKASGSYEETISLVNEIMAKNKLSNSLIYAGQEIKIINPALGQLKIRFKEMQAALLESLKTDTVQK